MGAWGTGPFDNDHASDFASYVRGEPGPGARQDMFAITFGAFTDMPDDAATDTLHEGYELPSIFEEVIASAAYIADAVSDRHDFTDTVYARGLDDNDEVAPFTDIGTPSPELINAALLAMLKALRLMRRAAIGRAWTDYPERIIRVLEDHRGGD